MNREQALKQVRDLRVRLFLWIHTYGTEASSREHALALKDFLDETSEYVPFGNTQNLKVESRVLAQLDDRYLEVTVRWIKRSWKSLWLKPKVTTFTYVEDEDNEGYLNKVSFTAKGKAYVLQRHQSQAVDSGLLELCLRLEDLAKAYHHYNEANMKP